MSSLSQFTIYTSSDPQGPNYINGLTGSLIQVLNACLVYGYGTKPAAGWAKPLPDISSSVGSLPILACYQQGSGSGMTLFVNDSAPNALSLAEEAWVTGWELMTSLTSSLLSTSSIGAYTGSNSQGFGYGQFPLSSQLLTYGHVVWRKSTALSSVGRPWLVIADASTMYIWIQAGDGGLYQHYSFGDIYSLRGSADLWKCYVYGKITENTVGNSQNNDWSDMITVGPYNATQASYLFTAQPGHYVARSSGGTGGSTAITKKGDAQTPPSNTSIGPWATPVAGVIQTPNGADNSLYMSPIWLVESSVALLRGRFRGMYQICHPISSFSDGQIIQGAGDYAGKTFMIVRGSNAGSMWAIETSATVETN